MEVSTRFIRLLSPLLVWVMAAVRWLERLLGPDDDWIENDRRVIYEAANRVLEPLGRPTIREVSQEDYIATVAATPDEIEQLVEENRYQRNLLSTRKYRTHHSGGKQWAVGSWVYDPAGTIWQHHIYLFPLEDETDVYGHHEPSVREPADHHGGDKIEHGVFHPKLRAALDGKLYTEKPTWSTKPGG